MSELGSVTIGVPTFNRPDGLAKALQCAYEQTYSHISIVVSDNALDSCEENEKVGARFSAAGKLVNYSCHQENIGAGRNFCSIAKVSIPIISVFLQTMKRMEHLCGRLREECGKMCRLVLFERFTGWKRRKGQTSQSVQHV